MNTLDEKTWFRLKSCTSGSALAPTWKGWVVTCLYLALIWVCLYFVPDYQKLPAIVIVNIAYIFVVGLKSDGTLFNENLGHLFSMIGISFLFIGLALPDGSRMLKILFPLITIFFIFLSVFFHARPRA